MTAPTERAPVHRTCTTPACDTVIVRYGEGAVTHCPPCLAELPRNRTASASTKD